MRKVFFWIIFWSGLLLAACSGNNDQFAGYRHKTAAKIFHNAQRDLIKKHYVSAIKGYEALDAIYPFGPHAQQAQIEAIYAYYKNDSLALAVAAADRYIRLYPRGKNVDYVRYMKGVISQRQGYTWLQRKFGVDPSWRDLTNQKQAFMAFNQLVILYPESPYVRDAILRMHYLRDVIARKSFLLSQFYYRHHAYVAAANRAAFVVMHFNRTTVVPEALAMMVKSYRKLGETALADNSYLILQASFPNSSAFKRVARSSKKKV